MCKIYRSYRNKKLKMKNIYLKKELMISKRKTNKRKKVIKKKGMIVKQIINK